MLKNQRVQTQVTGIGIAKQMIDFKARDDELFKLFVNAMTHGKMNEVRKAAINAVPAPYTPLALSFMVKRLRDKHPEIRRFTYEKFAKNGVTLESFNSKEIRMLIIKEGLSDTDASVKEACVKFLAPSIEIGEG